jgi:hypothetical protein
MRQKPRRNSGILGMHGVSVAFHRTTHTRFINLSLRQGPAEIPLAGITGHGVLECAGNEVGTEAFFGTEGRPTVTAELDSDGKMAPFFASARRVGASSVNNFGFSILDFGLRLPRTTRPSADPETQPSLTVERLCTIMPESR